MEERRLLRRRALFLTFEHLLRVGIDPLAPVGGDAEVDCVVRLENGGYREAVIAVATGPSPRWFRVSRLRPRHGLVVVCMSLLGENVETWVIPSLVFAEQAERSGGAFDLNLDSGPRAQALEEYRDAWHYLTQGAVRSQERPEPPA
ncbi:MAG TPA: hypothetical protein VNM43_12020 [Dehalococcoidia bacterium]|nr:hypothetical protein [Dehalococcoidia bacterium]